MQQTLISDESVAWEDLGDGIQRKIMAYNETMMLTKVQFAEGAVGTLHQHPHTQVSYVSKGIFDINIEGVAQRLHTGDVFFVPSELMHGAVCVEAGELIDIFTPMRADFVR
jgi:quercetin dioxygenase-like cupin family protein